jgi:hypothetical protein
MVVPPFCHHATWQVGSVRGARWARIVWKKFSIVFVPYTITKGCSMSTDGSSGSNHMQGKLLFRACSSERQLWHPLVENTEEEELKLWRWSSCAWTPRSWLWRPRFLINHNSRSKQLTVVKSRSTWAFTSKNSLTYPSEPFWLVDTLVGPTHGQRFGQTPLFP